MVWIVVEKIGGDMMTGIAAGKTDVDTKTETGWRMIDVDMMTEVGRKIKDVGMAIEIVAGKIGGAMRTGIDLLMIEIPGGMVIETETDTTRIEIVEIGVLTTIEDAWMTVIPMVPLMITTWMTGGWPTMVMIIAVRKVGADGIVTIIAGMMTAIQGDGVKENRGMEGMNGNQNGIDMTVLLTAKRHEMEMRIRIDDRLS